MSTVFFTIGHSTRSFRCFVDLLREAHVDFVADVRTIPRSRTNPQFNSDALKAELPKEGIGYEHIPSLGGLRAKQAGRSIDNGYWTNQSFRNYADYALSEEFKQGLTRLHECGKRRSAAIMCAEAVWWRCHRRIIADYLIAGNDTVFHILGPGKIEPARLTPAARIVPAGIAYPVPDNARP